MRLILRSLLLLTATVAAHCATPAPVFAQPSDGIDLRGSPPTTAASAAQSGTAPTKAPAAPAPSAPASAIEEAEQRIKAVEQVVEDWFKETFHGLGPQLSEFLFGHIRTAIEDLKQRLNAL